MWAVWPLVAAFGISLAGCWWLTRRAGALTLGRVTPTSDRWHQHVTPGLGGLPIFAGFAVVLVLQAGLVGITAVFLFSALPLLVLGLVDDLKPMPPRVKLVAQVFSALLFLCLVLAQTGQGGRFISSGWAVFAVALVMYLIWLLTIINATNLLDNMDGLSGGVSLIACLTIAVMAVGNPELQALPTVFTTLAAAIAGFLLLNIHPAKLFMGDAGSLWIGLCVAGGAVLVIPNGVISQPPNVLISLHSLLLPLLICAVPVSDTLMVMITRTQRGQSVAVGGKDHLSHRLVYLGISETWSVAMLWCVAVAGSVIALLYNRLPHSLWVAMVMVFVAVVVLSIVWLVRCTPYNVNAAQDTAARDVANLPGSK